MNILLQVVSLLGAGMVVGAFFALQRGFWSSHGRAYLWMNFLGAGLLCAVAVVDRRLGFIVLEFVWAAVALGSILRSVPIRE